MSVKLVMEQPGYKSYAVRGDTLEELQRWMDRKGPVDEHDGERVAALTTTRIDFGGGSATSMTIGEPAPREGGGYVVKVGLKDLSLIHRADVVHPEWAGLRKHPSKAVQAEWKRFMKCLMDHELEHVRESARMAREIRDALEAMTVEGTAATAAEAKAKAEANLEKKLKWAFEVKLTDTLDQLHARLDKQSSHGRRDGALLRTSIT